MSANQASPPLPNPGDWMTGAAVANLLGVHEATVGRWRDAGILTEYRPVGGPSETRPYLYWRPEVEDLRAARERVKARRRG